MTTKDSVLAILKFSGDYVSGEKISATLGISRMAVNTAVKSLRSNGYDILSATNKGYFLNNAPDRLTTGELLAFIPYDRMKNVICLDTVESTNNILRDMAYNGAADGQVVIANEQTQGRGRFGRSFVSPKDKGIYMSILLRPKGNPADGITLTSWTAVAVSNAIQKICGIRPGIKWVNDLVLGKKKLCGILTEMLMEGESGSINYVIIGIGLNVNEKSEDFPENLRHIATSLYEQTGTLYKRSLLAAEIIHELDMLRAGWPGEKSVYLKSYRENSVTVGKEIQILSGDSQCSATALSIGDDFSLDVKQQDGTIKNLSSGEISVRGLYDVKFEKT